MVVIIDPTGTVTMLYTELFDLAPLGTQSIVRASHVEPDAELLRAAICDDEGRTCPKTL